MSGEEQAVNRGSSNGNRTFNVSLAVKKVLEKNSLKRGRGLVQFGGLRSESTTINVPFF
jgi:hypothetical protein